MVRLRLLFACMGCLVLSGLPVWGQSTGSITGVVKDKTGGVVGDARVSLFRPDGTEPEYQTLTDKTSGSFSILSVSPLTYRLVIEKQGFGPYELTGVKVSPGVEQPINGIQLELGQTQTTVEAAAKVEGVQTGNAEITTTLTTDQLERLPLAQRNPLDLILTQAGINNNGTLTTINGLRVAYNNFSLESVSVQDNFIRSNGLDYSPNRLSLAQVSEFTIVTSNGSSTFGNGATQIALASPAGGNQYHGSLYFYNSNNLTNANGWFSNAFGSKVQFKQNQGGGTFGGPLKKNKLFFFTNYELLRGRLDVPESIAVPSLALRQGNYSFFPASPTNAPLTTFNVLQAAGLTRDSYVQSLINGIPVPNQTGTFLGCTPDPVGLTGCYAHNRVDATDRDNLLARLDYQVSAKQTIMAVYAWNQERLDRTDFGVFYEPRARGYNDDSRNFLSLAWRASLSPVLTNEVRFGFDRAPLTFSNRDVQATPFFLSFNGSPFGLSSQVIPQGRDTNTYTIQDNASWVRGRHNILFGFQAQLIRVAEFSVNQLPTVTLGTSVDCSNANQSLVPLRTVPALPFCGDFTNLNQLAAVLSGRILNIAQTFNVTSPTSGYVPGAPSNKNFRYDDYSFYVQDQWKVTRGLTLTAGLRYELYPVLRENHGLLLTPTSNGNLIQALYSPIAQFDFTQGGGGKPIYHGDHNNFAPNLGLAFDPFGRGKTVFRAAYSVSFVNDDTIAAVEGALLTNFGLSIRNTKFLDTGVTLSQSTSGLLAGQSSVSTPAFPSSLGLNVFCPTPGASSCQSQGIAIVDPNLRTPYVQQWSAGVQQMLGKYLIDVRYVGNHATKMLRQAILGPVASNPAASRGASMLSNFSNSTYNGLQASILRRLTAGLAVQANYTYSKALSDSNRQNGFGAFEPYRDTTNSAADRARSPFDLRHSFKANFIYDLPFGHGQRFDTRLNSVTGGWSVSGIVIAQSGNPYSILCGCNGVSGGANTASAFSSLNGVVGFFKTGNGVSVIAPSAINPNFFDSNGNLVFGSGVGGFAGQVFTRPAAGKLGILGYRSFNSPNLYDVNLGLQKRMKLTEHQSIELRGEALNLFNHPNFFVRDQTINSFTFGRNIGAATDPRRVQFAAYYRF